MPRKLFAIFLMILLVFSFPIVGGEDEQAELSEAQWYDNWMYDTDHDRLDDRVEKQMAQDPNAIIHIFVDYDHKPTEKDLALLRDMGLEPRSVNIIDIAIVDNVPASLIPDILELPGVVMVELDPPIESKLDISAPATKSRGSDNYSPKSAWELGFTGEGINIAVLDTGVDDDHESLDGKFIAGVDFTNVLGARDGSTNPDDGNGHGSHCAGTAMGDGGETDDNGDGEPDYMGTAPDARLIDVKISTDLGGNIGGPLIDGMDWCVEHKDDFDIRVLSISVGTTDDSDGQDATSRAANEAVDAGLVLVAAAGNDGPDNNGFGAPAAADKVITVGAIEDRDTIDRADDTIASYSNRGPRSDDGDGDDKDELKPEVVAPGTSIHSVQYSSVGQTGVGYRDMSGTSMACPHVAGIAALILEADTSLTPKQVKQILIDTAEGRGEIYDEERDPNYSKDYGYGIVDAYEAARVADGGQPQKELLCRIDSPEDGVEVSGSVDVQGTASVNTGSIEYVEVKVNDGDWIEADGTEDWSYSWDSSSVDDGEHSLTARAYDGEDNSNEYSIDISVNNSGGSVENKKPEAVIDGISPNPADEGERVEFQGHGEDEDGDIAVYVWKSDIDGEIHNSSSSLFKSNSLSVGSHIITYLVQDDQDAWSAEATDILDIEEVQNNPPELELDAPADGAVLDTPVVTLSWSGEDDDDDSLRYDVYLDTSANPTELVAENEEDDYLLVADLEDGQTYYWNVVVSDGEDETESDIWSFTIQLDSPGGVEIQLSQTPNGSTVKAKTVVFSWEGTNEGEEDLSYDLYLGTSPNPATRIASDLTESSYEFTDLQDGTTYYWRVVAIDGDTQVSSTTWEFTVKQESDSGDDDFEIAGMDGILVIGGIMAVLVFLGIAAFVFLGRDDDEDIYEDGEEFEDDYFYDEYGDYDYDES